MAAVDVMMNIAAVAHPNSLKPGLSLPPQTRPCKHFPAFLVSPVSIQSLSLHLHNVSSPSSVSEISFCMDLWCCLQVCGSCSERLPCCGRRLQGSSRCQLSKAGHLPPTGAPGAHQQAFHCLPASPEHGPLFSPPFVLQSTSLFSNCLITEYAQRKIQLLGVLLYMSLHELHVSMHL